METKETTWFTMDIHEMVKSQCCGDLKAKIITWDHEGVTPVLMQCDCGQEYLFDVLKYINEQEEKK